MTIDKKFFDQFINVTSKAALESSYQVGKNDKIAADKAAVDSMRNNLNKIDNWTNINDLIPNFYSNKKMKKTGLAGIFSASLELTKEGAIKILQDKIFDKILIKKSSN